MTLKNKYLSCLGKNSIADDIIAQRGLVNNFGAVYIPDGTRIDDRTYNAGILLPIYINNILRGCIYRAVAEKQFYRIVPGDPKVPLLYNIDEAIKDKSFVIVTESIIDCETIKQVLGINNVVSTLSASLKTEQLVILGTYFKTIYCCFDNDSSGNKAVSKLTKFMNKYYKNVDTEVIVIDKVKDVNEYLTEYGKVALQKLLIEQIQG